MENILIKGTDAYILADKVQKEQLDEYFFKKKWEDSIGLNLNCHGMIQEMDVVHKYMKPLELLNIPEEKYHFLGM